MIGISERMRRAVPYCALPVVLLGCCREPQPPAAGNATAPTLAHYSWMLPKTVLTVTATYTLVDCTDVKGDLPKLELEIKPTLVTTVQPDTDIGDDVPGGLIEVTVDQLTSFFQDRNIALQTYPGSHILQQLGSQPVDQVGTIVGNVFTGIIKTVGIALGVPTAGTLDVKGKPQVAGCGDARATAKRIKDLKDELSDPVKGPKLSPKQAKAKLNEIDILTNAISITVKRTIDPGITPVKSVDASAPKPAPVPINNIGHIGSLVPSLKQLTKAKWYNEKALSDIRAEEAAKAGLPTDLHVNVYLNFDEALPPSIRCPQGTQCSHPRTKVGKGTLFREVAYIPVRIIQGDIKKDSEDLLPPQRVAFGQFGIPRHLPFSAPLFGSLSWSVTFAENGEITNAAFGSKAQGVGASSLLSGAATAASSVAAERNKAAALHDPETLRLEAENAVLKAQVDNLDLKNKLKELQAGTESE